MPNRLIHETSPYLRQHAHNPVDWHPWGDEARGKAKAEDKPLLLSIGYSACHWCHVMEHESFEDAETASIMNESFVNIKVDREERPDLDQIYMTAVQGLTGHGGWPMTVFLTPDGKPFYGGTYFPPTDRRGLPSFRRVLISVSEAYRQHRSEIAQQADRIATFIQQQTAATGAASPIDNSVLDKAFQVLARNFDRDHGGFGSAPKFPQAMALEFLLRHHHRTGEAAALGMAEASLRAMALGGIYDQIGGGFHRYSVDSQWLVPHFEKMLYDNALLARVYLHAYQLTNAMLYRRVVEETLDYTEREMLHQSGGFFSTQDADSEGVEGKYYVWSAQELDSIVGPELAPILRSFYGITEAGNFEGKTILTIPADIQTVASRYGISLQQLAEAAASGRSRLLEARSRRVPPDRDEKVLASWNGLMLRTFSEAARALTRPGDLVIAEANAAFLLREMWRDGRLFRVYKDGAVKIPGYLEDYAAVADGLLALYETTFERRWYTAAREIAQSMIDRFWDEPAGAFFDAARDGEPLVARPRDVWDNATPSGTSLACHVLLRLWALAGDAEYERLPRLVFTAVGELMRQHAAGMGHILAALDLYLAPPQEIAIIGDPSSGETARLVAVLQRPYLPNAVAALAHPEDSATREAIPLLNGRGLVDGKPAAYVCRGFVCDRPFTEPEDLILKLTART